MIDIIKTKLTNLTRIMVEMTMYGYGLYRLLFVPMLILASSDVAIADQCPISMPPPSSGWQAQGAPNVSANTFTEASYITNVSMNCCYSSTTYPFPGCLIKSGSFSLTSDYWTKQPSINGAKCSSSIDNCTFNS